MNNGYRTGNFNLRSFDEISQDKKYISSQTS